MSTWDKIFDKLEQEFNREPTAREVQLELLKIPKLCIGCLFEKPLAEFIGDFCEQCRSEAEAAGVELEQEIE